MWSATLANSCLHVRGWKHGHMYDCTINNVQAIGSLHHPYTCKPIAMHQFEMKCSLSQCHAMHLSHILHSCKKTNKRHSLLLLWYFGQTLEHACTKNLPCTIKPTKKQHQPASFLSCMVTFWQVCNIKHKVVNVLKQFK